jgi:hypothetical protein
MSTTLARHPETLPARAQGEERSTALNAVRETMEALKSIRTFIKEEFVAGLDFGVIPGTGAKPTLLKPGAQKAAMYFNARPAFHIEKTELGNGHVEFLITTELVNRATDRVIGMGVGSCTTMESKYRYRKASKACPKCGAEAIIKGKAEYGGGFVCFRNKGGCGAKFDDRDPAIAAQVFTGRIDNPDVYDSRNTVLKMAVKRSEVAAALSLGCLSELFTQDLEETYDLHQEQAPEPVREQPREQPDDRRERAPRSVPARSGKMGRAADRPPRIPPDDWDSWITGRVQRENVEFRNHQTLEGITPYEVKDLTNVHRAMNHLATRLVECHAVAEGDLLGATGKRDKDKARRAVAGQYLEAPEWCRQVIEGHLLDCWARGCAALNLPNPHGPEEDPGAQAAAEDERQDVPEEVAAGGREPGDDG